MAHLITINKCFMSNSSVWIYTLLLWKSHNIDGKSELQCFRVYLRSCDQRMRDEFDLCSRLNSQHTIWIGWWCYNAPVYIGYDSDIVIIRQPTQILQPNETNKRTSGPRSPV